MWAGKLGSQEAGPLAECSEAHQETEVDGCGFYLLFFPPTSLDKERGNMREGVGRRGKDPVTEGLGGGAERKESISHFSQT